MKKIGVFVCHCGINIAQNVDVEALTQYASTLPNVAIAEHYKYMCSDVGATLIKKAILNHHLDAIVIACCSPRMHEHTFRQVATDANLNPYCVEIANIREQCSWVHQDKTTATEKAKALVRSAIANASLQEPLTPATITVTPEALVLGAGIAGIQTSLDLANNSYKVTLVERDPSIGGHMAQLDKTFPTLDCSGCILTPKMMEIAHHKNIDLLTCSEIISVKGSIGNYTIKIRKKPRYINVDKCTGCGDCATACRLKDHIPSEFDQGLGKRGAVYMPFPQAIPLKYTIDPTKCLYLTRGKCGDSPLCQKACVPGAIDFTQHEELIEKAVGTIIVATGYDLLDPTALYELGYQQNKDVITTLELERLINSSGPTHGEIQRPSNHQPPRSVTFILCVGSRDETQCTWCCRIGCMTALKQIYLLREKLGPDTEINLCYQDVRSYGKGYEEFYRKIRGEYTNLFRGRPSEVRQQGNQLKIDIYDTTINKLFEIKTDLVVLVPALIPRHDTADIARLLRLSRSSDGFFLEAHPKLRPMDAFVNGIFFAGCCQGPKDIQDTVAHASGAAARAAAILAQPTLLAEPNTAVVTKELCSGCKICIPTCPYSAIETEEETVNGKTVITVKVNEGLCQGCGTCVSACPSGAMQQRGFKDTQILAMIKEIT